MVSVLGSEFWKKQYTPLRHEEKIIDSVHCAESFAFFVLTQFDKRWLLAI
jgi:hypothetical protein